MLLIGFIAFIASGRAGDREGPRIDWIGRPFLRRSIRVQLRGEMLARPVVLYLGAAANALGVTLSDGPRLVFGNQLEARPDQRIVSVVLTPRARDPPRSPMHGQRPPFANSRTTMRRTAPWNRPRSLAAAGPMRSRTSPLPSPS